ncbi:hypothetical protein BJV82DRAFT_716952 [Fennellomyces sp. T-0311]|nr:hypothetical protein BJV82DRAFT_716952 [Fennellomyces sp. T-0311]
MRSIPDPKRKFDDFEDEWEREASSSTRNEPPNEFAKLATILDAQNDQLDNQCAALEAKIERLKASLLEAEQELSDENCRLDQQSIVFDDSLAKSFEMAQVIFGERQDIWLTIDAHADYLKEDHRLYRNLDQTLSKLRDQLPIDETHDTNDIDELLTRYYQTELMYMNAVTQQKGLGAGIQSLEKDLKKLNSLPKVLPILQKTIEDFENRIKKDKDEQRKLQQYDVEPLLIKIANATIKAPLLAAKTGGDHEMLQQYSEKLDTALNTLRKQHTIQELLIYAYDVENDRQMQNRSVLEALASDISEEVESYQSIEEEADRRRRSLSTRDEDPMMAHIDSLLHRAHIDSPPGMRRRSFEDSSLLTKVSTVLQYDKKSTEQWSDNFNSILDAARALEEAKDDVVDNLFENSNTKDNLIMVPSSYTDLQSDLDLRNQEVEGTIADLENATKEDPAFTRKKELFSAFFTDPNKFGELVDSP